MIVSEKRPQASRLTESWWCTRGDVRARRDSISSQSRADNTSMLKNPMDRPSFHKEKAGPCPTCGWPETVARKIHAAAQSGVFNTFMGEFNFSDLPERDLMRSIRLFGDKVIPALRPYEPF